MSNAATSIVRTPMSYCPVWTLLWIECTQRNHSFNIKPQTSGNEWIREVLK
jgi:hypothetical protein